MNCVGYLYIRDLFLTQTMRNYPELTVQPFWIDMNGKALDASPALAALGIRSGTPARQAKRIAPTAVRIEYRPEDFQPAQDLFSDIAYKFTPVVEPLHPGEIFLGLQGHNSREIAETLLAEVRDLGFEARIAVAHSRLAARLLGRISRTSYTSLHADDHPAFMAARPVECLWTLSRRQREHLSKAGCVKVGDLQWMHRQVVCSKFGQKEGVAIFEAVRGFDTRQVRAMWPPDSLYVEERFCGLDNRVRIDEALEKLAEGLSERLRRDLRQCRRLRLEVQQEGRLLPLSEVMVMNPAASGSNRLYLASCRLFGRLKPSSPIERIRITAEGLTAAPAQQLDLFTPLRNLQGQKEEFKAFLTVRFGSGTLKFCSNLATSWREKMLAFY